MFPHSSVSGSLFGNTQNKGFGFSSGLGTGAAAGTGGFGTGLGTTGLGGFGGFNIQPTQQQQGESPYFLPKNVKILTQTRQPLQNIKDDVRYLFLN